jgi:cell division protein FtsA
VRVDDVVLQPLASAEAVLTAEERRQGVIVADIGGGCTDLCVFVEGSIQHTATLPIGGNHITRDLVVGLRCPYHSAEAAKETYGHAIPSSVSMEETIEIEAFGAERQRTYPRRLACEIIQARCEEILEMIVKEARGSAEIDLISAGIVLAGGTARLRGLDVLAEQVTGMPARVGLPSHIFGLVDELYDPAYATSVGLLQWAMGEQDIAPLSFRTRQPGPLDALFKRLSNWFRVLLPE